MEDQTNDITVEADGYEDFASVFGEEFDNQTETDTGAEEAETEEPEDTTDDVPQEGDDGEESEDGSQPLEDPNPPTDDGQKPVNEQKFTIKVNKEEREVSYDEGIALMQKGSDYDRVKEQRDQARQAMQEAQAQLDGQSEMMEMISIIAKHSGMEPGEMVDSLFINVQKSKGIDEATARETLRADRLQRKVSAMESAQSQQQTAQQAQAARAQAEIAEFRKQFPDVQLTEEQIDQLAPDVQSGMSLANAYRKAEAVKKDAEIADLKRKLEAEKQNKRNRAASPGSQKDSGGRRDKSDFEIFNSVLFG